MQKPLKRAAPFELSNHRILLGAATFAAGRGGIARVARMTARALADFDARIEPISYLDSSELNIAGTSVSYANGDKLRFAVLSQLKALACTGFVYDSVGIARAHARILSRGAGYVVWMHGIEAWENLRADHHTVFKRARLVLVNSQFTLRRFECLHGELPQARVCWLSTEDDEPPRPQTRISGRPTVMVLSRLDTGDIYKGHDALIAAWPHIRAAVPEARLLIAGDGTAKAMLSEKVAAAGLNESVEFIGFVPETELQTLWQGVDVFAMPSRKEGFGLVYAEAMRHGVPVVASVHDAGSEVNVDGETGFNIDLERDGMLPQRLIELLRDDELRRRLGDGGRERWKRHFRFDSFKSRLRTILATS